MSDAILTSPALQDLHAGQSEALLGWQALRAPAPRLPATTETALVGDRVRAEAYREAISNVQEYRYLPIDWDTFGGLPASFHATLFSIGLLESLRADPTFPSPLVRPISGGVFLKWTLGRFSVYFEVEADLVLAVLQEGDQSVDGYEDDSFDVNSALDLIRRFRQLAI